LEVQVDNVSVVHALNSDCSFLVANMNLIRRIRTLMCIEGSIIHVIHVYREANGVADGLANLAFSLSRTFEWFDVISCTVAPFANGDNYGVFSNRNIRH